MLRTLLLSTLLLGASLLAHAEEVLNASDRLERHAASLAKGQEPRLTLALSDAYQPKQYEMRLQELDQRFADLQFESLIAEQADVLDLVTQGRAQLGLIAALPAYPPHIAHARLNMSSEFGLFVAKDHPLSTLAQVRHDDLSHWRLLRLSSVAHDDANSDDLPGSGGRCWAAPDYLMLLEMARLGFGWAELPRQLVDAYGFGGLHELPCNGWPRRVTVDAIWSRQRELGPVAAWLLGRLLEDS